MSRPRIKWRKWNNIIHRDLGYLCVGLTVVYAISGVAVNHAADWNPNYTITRETDSQRVRVAELSRPDAVDEILAQIEEQSVPTATFRPDPETLQIFFSDEGKTISVDLTTGDVFTEIVRNRPLLREVNFLHLNHPKKLWTYFADVYAVALALLAVTGLFVLKGKKGIRGRGAWLTAVGIIIPLVFLWLYL
ncbi:MAG: PepSY-associated TM helix domain-containing protein [Gemmatimonadota bacterium]|nr:PepSY-associated TM helix domain-containing protein [Gemmatimonadota bacterium]